MAREAKESGRECGEFLGDTRGLCKRICIGLTWVFALAFACITGHISYSWAIYIEIVLDIDADFDTKLYEDFALELLYIFLVVWEWIWLPWL